MVVALDRLQAIAPGVESVSLVVAWSGDNLRAGSCKVRPRVEVSVKSTTPISWSVNGFSRANAFLVSRDAEDRPVYSGTPSDFAVVQAIQEMKALRLVLCLGRGPVGASTDTDHRWRRQQAVGVPL